ncbi:hypothetical protein AJ79_03350 [Helicocarpus griseus UAMH5409]|uniref:Uncharacterized protein n=1 Tax=Helicocarpus griseus UAMH5409 TaxID=1447875 RepID=A0A2B7XYB5_9EURO|nr:hypothetical protein AJ79_03350 [Helicocarpus griseus UAMH5409]
MAQVAPKSCLSMNRGELPDCAQEEVRFSPTSPPMRRAQSLTVDKSRFKGSGPTTSLPSSSGVSADNSNLYFFGYIEQSRLALQSLRVSFERERAAFAEERKLWEKERIIMKQRITELEQGQPNSARKEKAQMASDPSGQQARKARDIHHIWEGSSPTAQPTRVFSGESEGRNPQQTKQPDRYKDLGFGSPPSLDEALSPRSRPVDRSAAVGVPIELVDRSLDGITLKSTALPPDVLARASSSTPSSLTSPSTSQPPDPKPMKPKPPLRIELSELEYPEENLIRDAGHTPMAFINRDTDTSNPDTTSVSTELGTLTQESPLAPQQTLNPGISADSYLPAVDEDPALEGPLGLQNDKNQDLEFLEVLDQKLLSEARKITQSGRGSDSTEQDSINSEGEERGEPGAEPGIRFRHSTNFGSAFGTL